MNIEIMGLAVIIIGSALLFLPVFWTALFMAVSTMFGATAAISMPALGGASLLVPSLVLVFFVLRIFMALGPSPALVAVVPGRPGFWLLILTIFGVLSAYFLPRLFAGTAETMTVTRSVGARNFISLVPLRPTSNNITQAVYALGGLFCFVFAFAYGRSMASSKQIMTLFLVAGTVNVAFALVDVLTYYTNTGYLLDFARTANYGLLTDSVKGGLKRISGTFAEASAFAYYSLGLFAFAASLWLDRTSNKLAGPVAGLLMLALVFSTSATALVGIVFISIFFTVRSIASAMRQPNHARSAFLMIGLFFATVSLTAIPFFAPATAHEISLFLNEVLFSKADSSSGLERARWNIVAYQTFMDTGGFGAGLGSARASSFALVLLSNIGVFGAVIFTLFIASVLRRSTGWSREMTEIAKEKTCLARATKAGFFCVIATSMISATVYDLGLLVYLFGGYCAAFCFAAKPKPVNIPNFLGSRKQCFVDLSGFDHRNPAE